MVQKSACPQCGDQNYPTDPGGGTDGVPGDFVCGRNPFPPAGASFDCQGIFRCEASDDFDCWGPASDFDCSGHATFECTVAQQFACFAEFDCQHYFRCRDNVNDAFQCLAHFQCHRAGDIFNCGQDTTPKYDCPAHYENPAQ